MRLFVSRSTQFWRKAIPPFIGLQSLASKMRTRVFVYVFKEVCAGRMDRICPGRPWTTNGEKDYGNIDAWRPRK